MMGTFMFITVSVFGVIVLYALITSVVVSYFWDKEQKAMGDNQGGKYAKGKSKV